MPKKDTQVTTDKMPYKAPAIMPIDISKALMVAASKSGMGSCKITYC